MTAAVALRLSFHTRHERGEKQLGANSSFYSWLKLEE